MNEVLTSRMQKMSQVVPGAEQTESPTQTEEKQNVTLQEDVDDYMRTQFVAEYAAMLRRKVDLELGIENAEKSGRKSVSKILQDQLDALNKRIAITKPVVQKYVKREDVNYDSAEEFENEAVQNKEAHDKLTDSYAKLLLAQDDYDLAVQQYDNIVGDAYVGDNLVRDMKDFDAERDFDKVVYKNGKSKDTIKEIYETMQDDDDLVSSIEKDHDERTDENEEEIITPEEKEEIQESVPENNPEEEFKEEVLKASKKSYVQPAMTVREKPVEAISSPSEPVSTTQPATTPEVSETVARRLKNTITTHSIDKNGNPISAEYSIEKKDDGFIWINFEIKKGSHRKARATIDDKVLQELGISFEDLYGEYLGGTQEGLDEYNEWKKEVLSDGDKINTIIIRPDGSVVIRTENGEMSEQASKKVILKLIPETASYFESGNNIQITTN